MEDPALGISRLKKAHALLPQYITNDEVAMEEAEQLKATLAKSFGLTVSSHTATPCIREAVEFEHPLASKRSRTSEDMRRILEQSKASQTAERQSSLQEECPIPLSISSWQLLGFLSEKEVA